MLEDAGILAALYTDSSAVSGLGRVAHVFKSVGNGRLHRLLQRDPQGIPPQKIYSSDRPFLSDLWARVFRPGESDVDKYQRCHRVLSRHMIRWGLQRADVLLTQDWEAYDFVRYAKDRGKKIVVDVNISPLSQRILAAAHERYPDWSCNCDLAAAETTESCFKAIAAMADVLLCPSRWVAEGVETLTPHYIDKIRICPYGSSIDYSGRTNSPVMGRVLFAGGDALRKGLPDLARAADVLKQRHPQLDFRVAGLTQPDICRRPECRNLNFLGILSSHQMQEEFLTADMFVLPTHSEGLAGVVLEAMAAGCPVITTRRAGIDMTDHVDGMIIEAGDPSSIVKAVETVTCDRECRDTLGANAKTLASDYSTEAWKTRLVRLLKEL